MGWNDFYGGTLGWDCFYCGTLKDEDLQEKIALFLLDYSEGCVIIKAEPSRWFMTKKFRDDKIEGSHPFNYFGVADSSFPHGMQFIFDRSAGGQLIAFQRIPEEYMERYGFDDSYVCTSYVCDDFEVLDEFEVILGPGADLDSRYLMPFALSVIKLRWWPALYCTDDSSLTQFYLDKFWKYGIARKILNERNNLTQCFEIWEKEHHKYYPPKQEDEIIEVPVDRRPKLVLTNKSDLDILLEDIDDLSPRLRLKLSETDLKTVGDLVKFSKKELVSEHNLIGSKLMLQIEELLGEYGLFLRDE